MATARNMELRKLGDRIRRSRSEKKRSLNEIAKTARISSGNLSEIEHGARDPRYCTLRALAKSLGVPLSKLIGGL